MATIGSAVLTLADWAKRIDPDGKTPAIVEMLEQTNEILMDMLWIEGNLPTGHRTTDRTGLPTVAWRLLNKGVAKSKSTTAQIDEACGIMEARSELDIKIAQLNANTSGFRLSESKAFVEAMNQEMAQTLFYGNSGLAQEEFTGLSIRYSLSTAGNGQNVLKAGGSGSVNSSIWLIAWGDQTVTGIFPKGSRAGLLHEDLGIGDAFDSDNNRFRAYMDRWEWDCGIALRDWRYAVRICNIDITNLTTESSAADLIKFMSRAIDRLPSMSMGRPVFYVNRTVASWMRVQAINKSYTAIAAQPALNQFGQTIYSLSFLGIPVRLCDQLVENEATVS
jgi:hypothetical protein